MIISIAIDDTHVCGMNPTDCLAAKCGVQADTSCQAWHGNACPWLLGCQACMACMQTGPISVILLAGLSLTLPGAPAIGFTLIFSMAQSTMDPVTLAMSHVGLPTSLHADSLAIRVLAKGVDTEVIPYRDWKRNFYAPPSVQHFRFRYART